MRTAVAVLTLALVYTSAAWAECDPNYQKVCVPVAADVDCAGGKGNGPVYVTGPFSYEGNDVYGLDREKDGGKDGVACEPYTPKS